MASDFELDAMLEIDDSQVDDVNNDLQASVTGGDGGDISPAEKEQQEGIVAGGVSKGLAAAGVLVGILSQLKSITGIINAVLGAISRALIPVVEKVADFIRPFIETANQLAANPGRAEDAAELVGRSNLLRTATSGVPGLSPLLSAFAQNRNQLDRGTGVQADAEILEELGGLIADALTGGSGSADQTGEVTKQKTRDKVEQAKRDSLGG